MEDQPLGSSRKKSKGKELTAEERYIEENFKEFDYTLRKAHATDQDPRYDPHQNISNERK